MARIVTSQRAIITKCTNHFGEPQENFRARYLLKPGQIMVYTLDDDDDEYQGKCFFLFVPTDDGYAGNYLRCSAADLDDRGKLLIFNTLNSIYEVVLLKETKEDYTDDQVRLVELLAKVDPVCIERLYKKAATEKDALMLHKVLLEIRLVAEGLLKKEAESVAESVFWKG